MPSRNSSKITPWRSRPVLLVGTAVVALLAVGPISGQDRGLAADLTSHAQHDRFERGYADLVETLLPAVVNVKVERSATAEVAGGGRAMPDMPEFFKRFFEDAPEGAPAPAPNTPMRGEGSGFIIDPEGFIVTNAHVVGGSDKISIVLTDGSDFDAELIGVDRKTDLALLKITTEGPLPFVEFGDSETVRVGDKVLAVGNPFGLGGTVTAGIISATGREIGAGPYDDFLQIDAPINRGNSGGPTFNLDGQVVGVNSVIYSPSGGNVGIGFAISANLAKEIVADLKENGTVERGWLGVSIQTIDQDLAAAFGLDSMEGALVSQVQPDSPAQAAGVENGDVILSFAGEPVETISDLSKLVAATDPNSIQTVEVWRDGEVIELGVDIGLMPGQIEMASAPEEPAEETYLGLSLAPLAAEQRESAGLETEVDGVVVTGTEAASPAAAKGIREGDIILRVGDVDAASVDIVGNAIADAIETGDDTLLMHIYRDGSARFIAVPLAVS